MIETLNSIRQIAYERQTIATFGHLAPKPETTYKGFILFTLTTFGDTCIIEFEFENLNASPWFNQDLIDFIANYTDKLPDEKYYGVFRFDGEYNKYKNGEFNFKGNVIDIPCGGEN